MNYRNHKFEEIVVSVLLYLSIMIHEVHGANFNLQYSGISPILEKYKVDTYSRIIKLIKENYLYSDCDSFPDTSGHQSIENILQKMNSSTELKSDVLNVETINNIEPKAAIGVVVGMYSNLCIIQNTVANSPAEKAGVQPNDTIIKIDNQDVVGMSIENICSLLRGDRNTAISITISRPGIGIVEKGMNRDTIIMKGLQYSSIKKDIGYIRLYHLFDKDIIDSIKHVVKSTLHNPKNLIIDLRNNNGGYINSIADFVSLFVKKHKSIFVQEGNKCSDKKVYRSSCGEYRKKKVVLLVGGGTKSGAYIVASAIKQRRKSVLIGKPIQGNGELQSNFPINDSLRLKLVTSKVLTSNVNDNSKSLNPDILIGNTAIAPFCNPFDISDDECVKEAIVEIESRKR